MGPPPPHPSPDDPPDFSTIVAILQSAITAISELAMSGSSVNNSKNEQPRSGQQAELHIPVEEYLRTRDSVVTGLTTLIAAINELVRAYIQHTNQLLSGGVNSLDTYAISNFLNTANTAVQTAVDGVGKGKGRHKKARKEKDPNAPKRPLTAFFLYSGSARPIVKADNPTAPAADVNAEILRRWKAISDEDKAKWKAEYERNNALYKEAVAAYKAETGREPTEDAHEADAAVDSDVDAGAGATGAAASDSSSDESSSDDEPAQTQAPPIVKPKPSKAAGKRKAKDTAAAIAPHAQHASFSSPSPSAQLVHKETPVPLPGHDTKTSKSGEKRKKDKDDAVTEEPKKKKPRKAKSTGDDAKPDARPVELKKDKKKRKTKDGA